MSSRHPAWRRYVLLGGGALVLGLPGMARAAQPGFDDQPAFPAIPGWFVAIFVLFGLMAIGAVALRISMARSMARRAGLDEDAATATAVLDHNGLAATYLASSLRTPAPDPRPAAPPAAEARLRELRRLLDQGLINRAEYDEHRSDVLDAI